MGNDVKLLAAVALLQRFDGPSGLTSRLADLEYALQGATPSSVVRQLEQSEISEVALAGALEVKRMAGQVNVAVHALGILLALPTILEEGERVEELSLGAGNTGRAFDLVTDRRVAEFKFIAWRGGAEAVRQNGLFIDVFHLAEATTDKRRQMYVVGLQHPLHFLRGGRALQSVLSRNTKVADEFFKKYGTAYRVVRDYWDVVKDRVELVDVSNLVPAFLKLPVETTVEE